MGNPMPPLANIPMAVRDLGAEQQGDAILAQFTLPTTTTENQPIRKTPRLDFRIGVGGSPFDASAWAAGATVVSGATYRNGVAHYAIPTAAWAGKTATLAVRAIGANGKAAAWSNLVTLPVVAPPEKPRNVRATDTAEGVHLTWEARGDGFRVFRRAGEEEDFTQAAAAEQAQWTDQAIEFGKAYTYRVQTMVKLAGGREALSDFSDTASATPQDVFPPAAPTGLGASTAPNSIELTWNANTEATLGSYSVYRAAGPGAFEKIAEGVTLPAYSDRKAAHGQSYRYAVTAVSRTSHESPRSETVETTLP